jgi:LiaI-LiaF-like transmembrane region
LFGETHVRAGAVVADTQRSFPAGAVILIAVGGLFLLRTLSIWRPDFDRFWPVILIVIGAALLVCRIPWKKSSE